MRYLLLILTVCLLPIQGMAQDFSIFANVGSIQATLLPLCGHSNGFSAKVRMQMHAPGGQPHGGLPFTWNVVNGISRQEILMTESDAVPPAALPLLKQLGIETLVIIARPERKMTYVLQPNLRAYCEVPMPQSALDEISRQNKMKPVSTVLGQESVNGHACNKVQVIEPSYTNDVAVVWRATDLGGFPVKMDLFSRQGLTRITFTDIRLEKPDASLVELPAGYTKLPDGKAFIAYAKELQKNQERQRLAR